MKDLPLGVKIAIAAWLGFIAFVCYGVYVASNQPPPPPSVIRDEFGRKIETQI